MRPSPETDLLIIHRDYRHRGGEEAFLEGQLVPELTALGATFDVLRLPPLSIARDVVELTGMALGAERLRPSYWRIRRALRETRYRAALFSNFVPTVSLAAPLLCRDAGLRVFHWVHNSRSTCANGISFDGKAPCTACFDRGSRSVLTRSCFPSYSQSLVYALAYRSRRVPRLLMGAIDEWILSAEYSAGQIRAAAQELGMPVRLRTVRMVPPEPRGGGCGSAVAEFLRLHAGAYFLFVGRLSFEKGADRVLDLARSFPSAQFAIAGKGPLENELRVQAPANVEFLGFVSESEREELIARAKALLVPSRAPENSPMILFESHFARTPVFYVKGGGAEETTHWLGRDGRDLAEFQPDLPLERRGQSFKGDELRCALAQWLGSVRDGH